MYPPRHPHKADCHPSKEGDIFAVTCNFPFPQPFAQISINIYVDYFQQKWVLIFIPHFASKKSDFLLFLSVFYAFLIKKQCFLTQKIT